MRVQQGEERALTYGGDVDENGVDRSQIRRMLALSPLERLYWLEETVHAIAELRQLNESR